MTQHLQALHDMATSSGMQGMDDKAANLFASLDRIWFEMHREKLTSPAFVENLKTFMLIRGGIAPSSPEAVPIVARAKAMTKLRLRLHMERGSNHGRDPEKGGQVDTSAQATSSVPLERRGVIVSAALKQTHRQTRSGWMAASSDNTRSRDVSRTQLRGGPVLIDARGAGEGRDGSYWMSHRAAGLQRLASLLTGGSFAQPLRLIIQNALVTMTNWLALQILAYGLSADPYRQDTALQIVFSLSSREYRLTLAEPFLPEPSASQVLLVAVHTAGGCGVVARVDMPSPSAKLKAARRLPKRLRTSGEAPEGDIARMRDEASARYERGESSSKTLHSCLQRTNQAWTDTHPEWWSDSPWSWHDAWSTSWSSGRGWVESEQSERGHPWWQEVDRAPLTGTALQRHPKPHRAAFLTGPCRLHRLHQGDQSWTSPACRPRMEANQRTRRQRGRPK